MANFGGDALSMGFPLSVMTLRSQEGEQHKGKPPPPSP
jgi:hypothetical protein